MRAILLMPLALLMAEPALPQIQLQAPPRQQNRQQRQPSDQDQLDTSPSIFAVLAAINASGYDAEIDSSSNHPLRKALREYLATQKLDSFYELRSFIRAHRKPDPSADLSQYISFALVLSGPPDFAYRYSFQALPPDAAQLDGLAPLLAAFYKEAHLEDVWKQVQPYYDQAIEQYQEPVAQAILQANAYLRNVTSGYLGRRFQIYVDLLGAPNQVQTRSYADDYFVVVTPAADLPIQDIQHAYLHYLADPIVLKFSAQMSSKRALGDYAQGAPTLEDYFRSDFILLSTECFIKAVESRIQRKPLLVDQALREGFVLTPALAEQLPVYEKQDRAMRLYFPDMVEALDLKKEEQRLEKFEFAPQRAVRTVRSVTTTEKPPELSGPEKTLEEAETAYTGRDLARAKEIYLRLLKEPAQNPVPAKAYYGLARIAVLERDPELGDRLFRKVLELEPDASTKSWSLLYLGRLADSQNDRGQAQEHYRAALAVAGVPDSVRQAAEKGLKEAFTK